MMLEAQPMTYREYLTHRLVDAGYTLCAIAGDTISAQRVKHYPFWIDLSDNGELFSLDVRDCRKGEINRLYGPSTEQAYIDAVERALAWMARRER